MVLLNDNLVYYEPIDISTKYIYNTFVLESLRRDIFSLPHTSPTNRKVGEGKLLFIYNQITVFLIENGI